MTPERIAELRKEYGSLEGRIGKTVSDLREILDALDAAQQEIADLKRGGVVVPEWNANAFALACVASGTYADGDLRAAIRNAEVGYNFAASRLRTIPADRERMQMAALKMMTAYRALRRESPQKPHADIGWMEVLLEVGLDTISAQTTNEKVS